MPVTTNISAVLQRSEGTLLGSTARRGQAPLGVFRSLANDVDDSIHGVGAPDRAPRTANHLDAVNVIEKHILHVPAHAADQRRVNCTAIDQDQKLVGPLVVEAAGTDGPVGAVDPGYVHAWHILRSSGMRVSPERCISSCVIT